MNEYCIKKFGNFKPARDTLRTGFGSWGLLRLKQVSIDGLLDLGNQPLHFFMVAVDHEKQKTRALLRMPPPLFPLLQTLEVKLVRSGKIRLTQLKPLPERLDPCTRRYRAPLGSKLQT